MITVKTLHYAFILKVFLLAVLSCRSNHNIQFPPEDYTKGLLPVVVLGTEPEEIFLRNFLSAEAIRKIDSLTAHSSIKAVVNHSKQSITLTARTFNIPGFSTVDVWIEGLSYSFLVRKSEKIRYSFRFDQGERRFRDVRLKGDMTGWESLAMHMIDGVWQLNLYLEPGDYHFVFVADGKEILDPENPYQAEPGDSAIYSQLMKKDHNIGSKPVIEFNSFGRNSINLEIENMADGVIAIWQNYRLPDSFITLKENAINIRIPKEAKSTHVSYLRLAAYNNLASLPVMLIILREGEPVNVVQSESR